MTLVKVMLIAAFVALVWTGCATTDQVVRVPVPVPCDIQDIRPPALPIDALSPEAGIFEHVRALWATELARDAYEAQLQAALEACRR